jgi:hypothetical protein
MLNQEIILVRGKNASFTVNISTVAANGVCVPANLAALSNAANGGLTFTLAAHIPPGPNCGYSSNWQDGYSCNSANNIIWQKTIGNGITLEDAANGVVVIAFFPADTYALNNRRSVYWDLQLSFTSGSLVYTAASGFLGFENQAPVNLANS